MLFINFYSIAQIYISARVVSNGVVVNNVPVIIYHSTNAVNWNVLTNMNTSNTLVIHNLYQKEFFRAGADTNK